MMTNGDGMGGISLSHPHTNDGFYFLLRPSLKYFVCCHPVRKVDIFSLISLKDIKNKEKMPKIRIKNIFL